jgi:hypothetical protein
MGVSGQRYAPAALLPPRKGPTVPIVQVAGWAPEPVWTQRLEEKSFAPNSKNENIIYMHTDVTEFKKCFQPTTNVVKDDRRIIISVSY